MPLKVGLCATESSGDILGSDLIRNLKSKDPLIEFFGLGGSEMRKEGFKSFDSNEGLQVMGIIDPIFRINRILKQRNELIDHLIDKNIDIFIGIDSPSLNLGISRILKKKSNIKTVQYVCPQVWAWRSNRAKKFNDFLDLILNLFPFEKSFLQNFSVNSVFVGHPKASSISTNIDKLKYKLELDLDPDLKTISFLPGSRKSEIKDHLPVMIKTINSLSKKGDYQFLIPFRDENEISRNLGNLKTKNCKIFIDKTDSALAASDIAVSVSGTATLECLLNQAPPVVCYKTNFFNNFLLNQFLKTKYISLPNILAEEKLIPELRQDFVNADQIEKELLIISETTNLDRIKIKFHEIHNSLKVNQEDKFNCLFDLV